MNVPSRHRSFGSDRRRSRIVGVAASLVVFAASTACAGGAESTTLRVSGSTTVNPVAADAAKILRDRGMSITVDTQGGSAGGLTQLAAGQIDIAMSSKPVGDAERRQHPKVTFTTTEIGQDAVGIVIRRNVYDGGVKSLSRQQLRRLFEGKVANWRELGGPDVPVYVYDKEPGRGTREVLDAFMYGKGVTAPPPPNSGRYAIVGGNEEGRTKTASTDGAVTPLSVAFAQGHPALAVVAVDGITPSPENVRTGKYSLARPLLLVTDGPPKGEARRFIDFVLSTPGQELVTKHGYLNLENLGRR
ncbi:phosphate ABC transporter substrate-binding protein [Thermomonospora umbrina]|uniref:Phosphate ABC transporter substrate-binding protein (PhoT family) n=1 Tax=Thermomonospora umbrina TaxID=111806 RepID=A0A3D9T414_9ACTN|nr:phosphate ABC transporter substrate-binding protein [Thermomonospora umbrina]REE99995.1 phosphate ABC transporter substrate-binding protein (PhoT family) [Thermomonospora umbrina]